MSSSIFLTGLRRLTKGYWQAPPPAVFLPRRKTTVKAVNRQRTAPEKAKRIRIIVFIISFIAEADEFPIKI
jgi:hypothetical protein